MTDRKLPTVVPLGPPGCYDLSEYWCHRQALIERGCEQAQNTVVTWLRWAASEGRYDPMVCAELADVIECGDHEKELKDR